MKAFAKLPPTQEIDQFLAARSLPHGPAERERIQRCLEDIRQDQSWLEQEGITRQAVLERLALALQQPDDRLRPLLNLTGTVIHTNLGRSVLSAQIFAQAQELATNYCNLEFSLATGKRGKRSGRVLDLLCQLTGAEAALVVNNNAAAVLLALAALVGQKEVIISRGELVEIGGSFRIPEIIRFAGAELKEVGTTNRTHPKDYLVAMGPETAALLKVHCSNYSIEGFTSSVSSRGLVELAKEQNLLVIEDLGSGALVPFDLEQLNQEPLLPRLVKDGVDLITFSGDKLLGGPQAGLVVGKKALVQQLKEHQLYRALRPDKLTLALLEFTLEAYLSGQARDLIPTQRMLNLSQAELKAKAEELLAKLGQMGIEGVECRSTPGGGALPGKEMDSYGLKLNWSGKEDEILQALRQGAWPIIGRIQEGKVILDLRSLLPGQEDLLVAGLKQCHPQFAG